MNDLRKTMDANLPDEASTAEGMGDGQPAGSSQGLAGAQGSGVGAERGPPRSIAGGPSPD